MEIFEGILKISRTGSGQVRHKVHYKNRFGRVEKITIEPDQRAYGDDIEDGACVSLAMQGKLVIRCALAGQLGEGLDRAAAERQEEVAQQRKQKPEVSVRQILHTPDQPRKQQDNQNSGGGGRMGDPLYGYAPYNFSYYEPGLIAPPREDEEGKWSGRIDCKLEALTLLLVGGRHEKRENGQTVCRFLRVDGKPCIPGSSIKGMLRALVEILSYSGLRPMNKKKLFWRNVAKVNGEYKQMMGEELKGGFLRRYGTEYKIIPANVSKGEGIGNAVTVKTGNRVNKPGPSVYSFQKPGRDEEGVDIDGEIVHRLWDQLTDNQRGRPHVRDREKLLVEYPGLPVFYREESGKIAELGFCRYFRVAYKYSPYDLAWPKDTNPDCDDIARRIFGHAGKDGEHEKDAVAGRVAVTACALAGEEIPAATVVLGSPKPTCLPFYICQNPDKIKVISDGEKNDPDDLKNYNDPESSLRGRKLYWHHEPNRDRFPVNDKNQNVMVELHPLKAQASGTFSIHVRDLTDSELGCLFEALELSPGHAHKLGMGRPLGFGSVKITVQNVFIDANREKYASLAARLSGARPEMGPDKREELRKKFRDYIFDFVKSKGHAGNAGDYYRLEPINQLYMILNWQNPPASGKADYMPLTQFKFYKLLPEPKNVAKRNKGA